MALITFGAIFASVFGCASAHYDIKRNLESGHAASLARLQELYQETLNDLAEENQTEIDLIDDMAQEAKKDIPPSADGWHAPSAPWIIDTPKLDHVDNIIYGASLKTQMATVAYIKDGCAPSAGWPALVTVPGRKNLRSTMQYISDLLASKGRITMNIDMTDDNRLNDIKAAMNYVIAENLTYNVNTEDISLFGYSLGAITLAEGHHKKFLTKQVKAVVIAAGASLPHLTQPLGTGWKAKKTRYGKAPPVLIVHCSDDGLVPYTNGGGTKVPEEYVRVLQAAGIVAHGLFYDNGCYHHPFKNLGFFDQVDLFLKDPIDYQIEIYADNAKYQAMMDNYEIISETKGCAWNDDGVVPFKAFEMFNQMQVCQAACYQAYGCVAIDWYKAYAYERPTGSYNCFLYREPCETPLYDVCTNKDMCPVSMKMKEPPSVFLGSSLTQTASKPAFIQRHRSLRGGGSADNQLKKVRTKSMCETDESTEESLLARRETKKDINISHEGQLSLVATLEAVDSVGCDFVFGEFGQNCEEIDGEPTHLKDALECEQASARLEGYDFSGVVEADDAGKYPHGCFLQANTGVVMFNPSDVKTVELNKFALACQQCSVFLEPTDVPLKNYNKTFGDTSWVSYCAGEYKLGVFDTLNISFCAEQCDALEACKHFAFCTVPQKDCCQLSSTCTKPYKSASAAWDGFMKLPPPSADTALPKFEKTAGMGCGVEEYVLDSFSIDDPAICAKKCEESDACTSFSMCTNPSDVPTGEQCCRLSSSCSVPYTHSSPGWDGYMSMSTLEKKSIALRSFTKTSGEVTVNSYCTGSYNLALFRLHAPDECAAKCLANKACTHFRLCKGDEELCCQLSSTCTLPYTTASENWDGYLNLEISKFRAAASSSPVASEKEVFEVEPLCTARFAPIDLESASMTLDTSNGFQMLWAGVAEVEGEAVDLLITGDNYTKGTGNSYKAPNGVGVINVGMGTHVDLTFKLKSASRECVPLDEIHFTVLELNKKGNIVMDMIWEFTDAGGYVVKPSTTVDVASDGAKTTMTATSKGFCNDATINPSDLKEASCYNGWTSYEQENRAAMVVYKRACEFSAKLFAPGEESFEYGWPFRFTFSSELAELCS